MTKEDVEKNFPWFFDYWKTAGPFFGRPPGGESIADVAGKRVNGFLHTELYPKCNNKSVLIVSHGGTMDAFRYLLENWSYKRAEDERSNPTQTALLFVIVKKSRS